MKALLIVQNNSDLKLNFILNICVHYENVIQSSKTPNGIKIYGKYDHLENKSSLTSKGHRNPRLYITQAQIITDPSKTVSRGCNESLSRAPKVEPMTDTQMLSRL